MRSANALFEAVTRQLEALDHAFGRDPFAFQDPFTPFMRPAQHHIPTNNFFGLHPGPAVAFGCTSSMSFSSRSGGLSRSVKTVSDANGQTTIETVVDAQVLRLNSVYTC